MTIILFELLTVCVTICHVPTQNTIHFQIFSKIKANKNSYKTKTFHNLQNV